MPDVIISLSTAQAARFSAACNAKLLRHYVEDTGIPDPTPQQLGEWCFKYLARKFTLRYEKELHDSGFSPDPFEGVKEP